MEAAKEERSFLDNIRPPRLEDAGLEDCALPPEAIKEAFFKAANSIRSLSTSILTTPDDDCLDFPAPSNGEFSDSLVGIVPISDPPGPCSAEKGGGLPEVVLGDEVAAGVTDAINAEESSDRVLGVEVPEVGKACVDGLQGLKIREKFEDNKESEKDDEKEDEKPI